MLTLIDEAEAHRFLSALDKSPTTARLRAFPHRSNINKASIGPRKGNFDLTQANLWQQEERGVYLVINNGGDRDASITECIAFFLEWDNKPIDWQLNAWKHFNFGEPSIIVTTGGKSVHLYWILSEPITTDRWIPVQSALISHTSADPTIRNPSRVMRLPGAAYIGPKGNAIGRTCIHAQTQHKYTVDQIEQWLCATPAPAAATSRQPIRLADSHSLTDHSLPPRPPTALREALLSIPPFQHGAGQYQLLLGLALRLHVELGSSEAQSILTETCCSNINDLSSYFGETPQHIKSGSIWPYLREHFGIDISRHDLSSSTATASHHSSIPLEIEGNTNGNTTYSDPPRDIQIQSLLDQLLDLHLDPSDPWAQQQAARAELWNLGVRGNAIDDRIFYQLAERWNLPLQARHSGERRGKSISDPCDSPADDLLPGFLLWRRDHVLFGPGGSGKTMAAAAMGAAIIKGEPFLDQQIPPHHTGRILWIGTDGGEGARAMVIEYMEDLGLADDPDILEGFTIWTAEAADNMPAWCCSPRGLLELKTELETGGYALVVIDSLKAVLELAGINFGIGPVGTLMRLLQALVGRHCSLLWLHHPAGGKAAGKGLQAAAGNQNINQIPSAVHQITRTVNERGSCNEWSVHKLRGSQSREFSYRLTEDGFEVTQGEITGNARAQILDCLDCRIIQGLPTATHLLISELTGASEKTIRNNLTWLRKRGLISKKGTAWLLTKTGKRTVDRIQQGDTKPWI